MNQIIPQVLGYLIDFAQYIRGLLGNASPSGLNYVWLIIFFFVFAVFLVGFSFGRSRILISLLCLYIAAFLESHFVFFDELRGLTKDKSESWLHAGLFLIIFAASFAILNRSALKRPLTLRETSFFSLFLAAVLEVGFLASLLISYFPPEAVPGLPAGLVRYFGTENARFWWALAPLVFLLFIRQKSGPSETA